MSSGGDDEPPSPSAFLEAPSSQSLIVDTQPFTSQPKSAKDDSVDRDLSPDEYSQDERENRFPGPANTWRKYTADERGLIASLDQERANDLSVHLYNAHALKSRLYDPDVALIAKQWHSKRRWIKDSQDGSSPWHPDQNWTAWPLRADDVPRKSEGFGKDPLTDDTDEGTLKMRRPWRAGADLQDEVQALMLRRARNRFEGRAWATDQTPRQAVSRRSHSISQMPSSPPIANSRQSSVASDAHSHTSGSQVPLATAEPFGKPSFIVDDDEASRLVKHGVRHVSSKLDDLLVGLHKSRHRHAAGSIAGAEPTKRSQSNKRKRRSTADEQSITATNADSEDIDAEATRKKKTVRDYNDHPSGQHGLHPRDWSEVLGMASLVGWNPVVIDRAAKRCAALFGERIVLRTMPESAAGRHADSVKEYTPQMLPEIDSSEHETDGEEEEKASDAKLGFNCPEESCPQRYRCYEKRWQIRQHLKYTHKYSHEALDAYDQSHTLSDAKLSIEQQEQDDCVDLGESDEENEKFSLAPAVDKDGFMEPVEVSIGRGTDVAQRTARSRRSLKQEA